MNIRFDATGTIATQVQNLFQGRFYDISPLWFYEVGTVICMTMVINIGTIPVSLMFSVWLKWLAKIYDQSKK